VSLAQGTMGAMTAGSGAERGQRITGRTADQGRSWELDPTEGADQRAGVAARFGRSGPSDVIDLRDHAVVGPDSTGEDSTDEIELAALRAAADGPRPAGSPPSLAPVGERQRMPPWLSGGLAGAIAAFLVVIVTGWGDDGGGETSATGAATTAPPGASWLGIDTADEIGGVRITVVEPGSAAANAGLAVGDIITEFEGVVPDDPETLRTLVRNSRPSTFVDLTVIKQDGQPRNVELQIGARPD
jgi:hypothetical protein